ncbi:MAG: flippase activity-associated protein Agl23 [Anaerolineae bacterium]
MIEETEKLRSPPEVQQFGPPWLTVETGFYLLLVLLGALLRFNALGRQPLQEKEAQLALDVWRFYRGGAASIRGHSPLLFHGNALLYLLFGANDFVARVLPALAGTLLIALPYPLRPYLGRSGALISAAILAFSPSFVFFSRQLGGEIIVSACALALLAGILGYTGRAKDSSLWLLAGALAIALLAGGGSYVTLLALGGFFLALWVRAGLKPASKRQTLLTGGFETRPSRHAWLVAAGIFAALVLAFSTGLFVNLHGLQATLDLLPAWLSQFQPLADSQPWHYYLSLLLTYESLVLIFGLAGACYLARRDLFSALLVCWFGVSLLLYSLMGTKPPSGLLQILVPLTLLAGRTLGELLGKVGKGKRWLWDRLALLIAMPAILHMLLQLSAFADPEDPGEPSHLILVFMSLLFLLCVILITGTLALDWRGALRTGGLVTLLFLGSLMVQATWRLNYYRPGNPLELLVERPTSPDVRNLARAIEDFSNQQERDRHSVDITVQGQEDPLLAWYLRDFTDLAFLSGSPSSLTPVVIVPIGEPLALPEYRGARFRIQSSWQPEDMPGHDLASWFLFREALAPPTHRDVVMWVALEPEE